MPEIYMQESEAVGVATDRIKIDQLATAVMEGLQEYADLATKDLKAAVKKAGSSAKKDVQEGAPENTGAYKKSWTVKTTKETSNSLEVTVYSRNRYQLAHLLEYGHARRNGGRTRAFVHIAPAEKAAAEMLEREVEAKLK
jgi:hypothetical protein